MDIEQFYPTPPELGRTLCALFEKEPTRVLEPSAGRGHLLRALRSRYRRLRKDQVDVYELNPEYHNDLREQATVRGLDFLESGDLSVYSHVLMNPPFRNGVSHVLHAWDRIFSGEIAAILNASGIREPATKEEHRLARLLAQHGRILYVQDAFLTADTLRKTSVEVALIHLRKEPTEEFWNDTVFDQLALNGTDFAAESEPQAAQGLAVSQGQIPALVRAFRIAWEARKESLLAAYRADHFLRFFQMEMHKTLGTPFQPTSNCLHRELQEAYTRLRHMAWMSVLHLPEFQKHLTCRAQAEIQAKFETIEQLEFSVSNIYGFLQGLALQQGDIQAQMVCDLFDQITYANSENCVFYRWKSNEKHQVGMALKCKRFILSGFSLGGVA